MQYHKLNGIIINRRSVSDADRFLTIYTESLGKISVYAKAVRSLKSKRGSSLDLFSHISFELVEKGPRRTLTSVILENGHNSSKDNLTNISRLFQIGELIDVLTPEEDPHPEVYELLSTALTHLHRFDTPEYLTRFKKKLLTLLGYGTPTSGTLDDYIDSLLTRPIRTRQIL